jgi:hypothetical protein
VKKKLGLTRGELETAIDRGMAACRIYVDRESIRLCQTGVVHLQRLVKAEGPTVPGQVSMAARVAKSACRAMARGEFEANLCKRGVDLAAEALRSETGISGRRLGIIDIDAAVKAAGAVHRDCAELHEDKGMRSACQKAAAAVSEAVIVRGADLDATVKVETRDCARKGGRRMDTIACQQGIDFMRVRLKQVGLSGRRRR